MLAMTIKIIDKISSLLNTITGKLATILLFAMMLLTSLDVVGRLLIRPIHGTHELTYLGLAVMVFISLGFTQGAKGHISVDVIVNRFPQRVHAIFDTISYLSALVIVSLMAWQTYEFALRKMNNVTGDLKLPVSFFVFISVVGIVIYAISILVDLLKAIQKVVNNHDT